MKGHNYLRVALFAFGCAVAAGMVWLLYGCHSPTDPSANCAVQMGCDASSAAHAPSDADVAAAMLRARSRLQSDVASGAVVMRRPVDWNRWPRVEFRSCPFPIYGADCNPAGTGCSQGHITCAAGETDQDRGEIIISTFEPARTIPLIEWEIRNWFLDLGGREDLAA